ncbi:MAG: SPOR domain-containing protein [Paraprevotella sp.]|nr:SPOR domain-containing protein [Paraprevotella sp.]
MKELAQHIEALLLKHDCVVIPQFGGFVTQRVASVRAEDEDLFLPPFRTVGFNPKLQANDGLLISSFMTTYRIDEAEAKKMLNQKVLTLRQSLLENGLCDFEGIGLFSQNEDGEIQFSPYESGAVCPAYYGLDAFEFPLLKPCSNTTVTVADEAEENHAEENNESHITIRINKRWINYAATAVAAVLLFILFSPTAENTGFDRQQMQMSTPLIPTALLQRLSTMEAAGMDTMAMEMAQPEITPENHKDIPDTETVQPKATTGQVEQLTEEPVAGYAVVVVSSVTEKNAGQYVENLKKRGIEGARVYKKGKMVRVIFDGFETEAAAYTQLNKLKHNYTDFETAWVLNLN